MPSPFGGGGSFAPDAAKAALRTLSARKQGAPELAPELQTPYGQGGAVPGPYEAPAPPSLGPPSPAGGTNLQETVRGGYGGGLYVPDDDDAARFAPAVSPEPVAPSAYTGVGQEATGYGERQTRNPLGYTPKYERDRVGIGPRWAPPAEPTAPSNIDTTQTFGGGIGGRWSSGPEDAAYGIHRGGVGGAADPSQGGRSVGRFGGREQWEQEQRRALRHLWLGEDPYP